MEHATQMMTRQTDMMDPARASAFQAALNVPERTGSGDTLPPFFHQLYFWQAEPPGNLGRDGHPRVGGIIPDMGLPRRMWAGGRMEFGPALRAGVRATRITSVDAQTAKAGRTGPLGFVTLRHEYWQDDALCLTEWQDLVYREDPDPAAPSPVPPVAPMGEDVAEQRRFDTTLLFRYSALTFNGHRIHYDVDYARETEGYAGLVVHGPLLAQHLLLLAARDLGPLRRFAFRATAPLMHFETAEFCRKGCDLWVRGPDGRQCMQATAEAG